MMKSCTLYILSLLLQTILAETQLSSAFLSKDERGLKGILLVLKVKSTEYAD